MRIPAVIVVWLLTLWTAGAHVVSQLYSEWRQTGENWQLEVQFEAGFADPLIREDPDAPAPYREWLLSQGEPGWEKLRLEAERYLRESLVIRSADEPIGWTVEFPDFKTSPPDFPKLLTNGAYMRMIVRPESQTTPTLDWKTGETRPDLILKLDQAEGGYLSFKPGQSHTIGGSPDENRGSLTTAFIQGFLHVVPEGLDHILFVLGLFFYQRKWRPLIRQSLAFTAAHTVTLGLAASGIVTVSGNWVEPLIAFSIAAVAIENLRPRKSGNDLVRLAVVFGFGLIHGLGFAGALSTWLKPGDGFLPALLSANLGVEVAQAALLGAAWLLTIGWSGTQAYRFVKYTFCIGIAITGLWWAFERITG